MFKAVFTPSIFSPLIGPFKIGFKFQRSPMVLFTHDIKKIRWQKRSKKRYVWTHIFT